MAAAFVPLAPGAAAAAVPAYGDFVDLGGIGRQIEPDPTNGIAYVSIYGLPKVAVVDLDDRSVASFITVASPAYGLGLSPDGSRLYVAMVGTGSVAEVNTATGATLRTFDLETELGHEDTWDVELVGNDLFVSAGPGSRGLSWIVKLDLATEDAKRVASGEVIRGGPKFIWGGGDNLYVGEGFSPNSLYRLDLTDPDAPIVAEDDHGKVAGTQRSVVASQGTLVVTGGGQELDALSLQVLETLPGGFAASSSGGSIVFMATLQNDDSLQIRKYDVDTNSTKKNYSTTCTMTDGEINDFRALPGNTILLASGIDGLCVVDVGAPFPLCDGKEPTVVGTSGSEELEGTPGDDVFLALGGDDELIGFGGNDTFCGGAGDDEIIPGPGDDRIFGESGSDTVSYGGADGPIKVDLDSGVVVGSGNEFISSIENVTGTAFNDVLRGNGEPNELRGADGDDLLVGRGGPDRLFGGNGRDVLRGSKGSDKLYGGGAEDFLEGGPGDDLLDGEQSLEDLVSFINSDAPVVVNLHKGTATGDGMDTLVGVEGAQGSDHDDVLIGTDWDNLLIGERGRDELRGRAGDDVLDGSKGDDLLKGGSGRDVLLGFTGNDQLIGGLNADLLAGEKGDDVLSGGKGIDAASFELSAAGVTVDLVAGTAFGEGTDSLDSIRDIVGSATGDTIAGDSRDNVLIGLAGDDTLSGKSGDDGLDGGEGVDTIQGGQGSDTCVNGESYASCETLLSVHFDLVSKWHAYMDQYRLRRQP